ncbi:hypothetical protein PU629_06265 [Pullulanibacillus sp. KACC 23026]|uniref:hypothetical protein n=1 Tax=Pullulanibacillus sp. KACC 23026 TaxID=3028315 RepID=UPI0023AFD94D|nr:hypothetical protein [Pullulanibacillus sp. KACC 23026]WEG13968.1 hypothetical protein PU629_06265 [Pullulanibacillus sp. KACC 23026]
MDSQGSVKEWQQVCVQKDKEIERLLKEISHWKKCTESEQKIAGKLQNKVETFTNGIREVSKYIDEHSGDVDHPRRLTMDETFEVFMKLSRLL